MSLSHPKKHPQQMNMQKDKSKLRKKAERFTLSIYSCLNEHVIHFCLTSRYFARKEVTLPWGILGQILCHCASIHLISQRWPIFFYLAIWACAPVLWTLKTSLDSVFSKLHPSPDQRGWLQFSVDLGVTSRRAFRMGHKRPE